MFPPGCNHTQTLHCLPTCLGKMPDDCSIHACSWFSGKPSKIHPYWTKTWNSYWSWKRKKKKKPNKIHTTSQCNLHKNYLILIPPQHRIAHGGLWEKKANMEHWYFCEMHALPHSNGNLWIVAMVFFFSCFNLKNKTKPTSISNKNNPKQFLQFWNIQKDTSPHCGYIKKKKELNKSKDRFNAKNTEENMHAFIIFLNYTGKLTVMEPAFPELMKQQSKRKKKEKRAFCSLKSLL